MGGYRHEVVWNVPRIEEFRKIALLSDDEVKILYGRMNNDSRIKIASDIKTCLSNLDDMVSKLKVKYDDACQFSEILPQRKASTKETFKRKKK